MAITPRLELRQGQSLVMTPQLQQAIKLLQMNNMELKEFVEQELAENPMLERDESDGALPEEAPPEPDNDAEGGGEDGDGAEPDALESMDISQLETVSGDSTDPLDMDDYDNVWDDGGGGAGQSPAAGVDTPAAFADWGNGGNTGFQSSEYGIEQTLSQATSLRDHLLNQINMDIADPADRLIAVHLTDLLVEHGRLPDDWQTSACRLGAEMSKLEAVLKRLQQFDPPGIYARDLAECWAIQLREKDRLDPAMETLLQNMELLKLHEYDKLSEICCVDHEDIKEMIAEIWALNHNPAEAFEVVLAETIIPDVLMRPGGGGWIVELNNEILPKVLINNHYYAEINGAVRNKEERQYVTDKFQSANWLVKSIHQRATTILKVAAEIVKQQEDFFRFGIRHLKPLILKNIAEEIEMHESTVSRVTSNKYMHTPRGLFELKYFFTSAIQSSMGGEAHSAEAVRHRIKSLINAEPVAAILSDDKLVTMLRGEGIDIARRTVAKYRDSLCIPSSVQRRREKKSTLQLT